MTLKSLQAIPVWQRIIAVIVVLGLAYFQYRGGTGRFVITISLLFIVRSLYKSGALDSKKVMPVDSALRPRSFVGDGLVIVGTWMLALFWIGVGAILVKNHVLADTYLSVAIVFGPPLVLVLVGAFYIWRVLNGFMFGRRHYISDGRWYSR